MPRPWDRPEGKRERGKRGREGKCIFGTAIGLTEGRKEEEAMSLVGKGSEEQGCSVHCAVFLLFLEILAEGK